MRLGKHLVSTLLTISTTLCIACISSQTYAQESRTWTDKSGEFQIEAELVTVQDDKVQLKTADGETMWVAIADLSTADRRMAREFEKKMNAASGDSGSATGGGNLKLSCKPTWSDMFGGEPELSIDIIAKGKAAGEAYQFGKVTIEEFTDEQGETLKYTINSDSFDDLTEEMIKVKRHKEEFFSEHPKGAVKVPIEVSAELKGIKKLKGEFTIVTGGEQKQIEIEDVASKIGQELEHPVADELGLTIKTEAMDDGITFDLEGDISNVLSLEIVDSRGREVETNGFSFSEISNSANYSFMFDGAMPQDMKLKIETRSGGESMTVPFDFSDVKIPSKPKNN